MLRKKNERWYCSFSPWWENEPKESPADQENTKISFIQLKEKNSSFRFIGMTQTDFFSIHFIHKISSRIFLIGGNEIRKNQIPSKKSGFHQIKDGVCHDFQLNDDWRRQICGFIHTTVANFQPPESATPYSLVPKLYFGTCLISHSNYRCCICLNKPASIVLRFDK